MEIVRCEKGHYYDADVNSSCPQCAAEAGQGGMDPIGATMPVYGDSGPLNMGSYSAGMPGAVPGGMDPIGKTEPVNYDSLGESAGGYPGMGATVPVKENGFITADFVNPGFDVNSGSNSSKVQKYDEPTGPIEINGVKGFRPVVGWLVCIDGADKGTDYRIFNENNYIGRDEKMDICIRNDSNISRENAANIGYDNMERKFFFGPAGGRNTVRVNNKMVINMVELNPYDILTVGSSKLMFVPLCGERFDWNAYE